MIFQNPHVGLVTNVIQNYLVRFVLGIWTGISGWGGNYFQLQNIRSLQITDHFRFGLFYFKFSTRFGFVGGNPLGQFRSFDFQILRVRLVGF